MTRATPASTDEHITSLEEAVQDLCEEVGYVKSEVIEKLSKIENLLKDIRDDARTSAAKPSQSPTPSKQKPQHWDYLFKTDTGLEEKMRNARRYDAKRTREAILVENQAKHTAEDRTRELVDEKARKFDVHIDSAEASTKFSKGTKSTGAGICRASLSLIGDGYKSGAASKYASKAVTQGVAQDDDSIVTGSKPSTDIDNMDLIQKSAMQSHYDRPLISRKNDNIDIAGNIWTMSIGDGRLSAKIGSQGDQSARLSIPPQKKAEDGETDTIDKSDENADKKAHEAVDREKINQSKASSWATKASVAHEQALTNAGGDPAIAVATPDRIAEFKRKMKLARTTAGATLKLKTRTDNPAADEGPLSLEEWIPSQKYEEHRNSSLSKLAADAAKYRSDVRSQKANDEKAFGVDADGDLTPGKSGKLDTHRLPVPMPNKKPFVPLEEWFPEFKACDSEGTMAAKRHKRHGGPKNAIVSRDLSGEVSAFDETETAETFTLIKHKRPKKTLDSEMELPDAFIQAFLDEHMACTPPPKANNVFTKEKCFGLKGNFIKHENSYTKNSGFPESDGRIVQDITKDVSVPVNHNSEIHKVDSFPLDKSKTTLTGKRDVQAELNDFLNDESNIKGYPSASTCHSINGHCHCFHDHGPTATADHTFCSAVFGDLHFPKEATITNLQYTDKYKWRGKYRGRWGWFPPICVHLDE